MKKINLKLLSLTLAIFALANFAAAQTTAFTYQGRLNDTMSSGSGSYLMKFELYADAAGNMPIDTLNDVPVTVLNNVFTVQLNFTASNAFDGGDRYLKISVKRNAGDTYTPLDPLQPITSTPYSIKAKNATTADISTDTLNVGGTPAAQIIKEGDTRLTDNRTPTAGSTNYIQNQNTAAQTSSNFNISGTGAANIFNAATRFDIGGSRVLSVTAAAQNTLVGLQSGNAITSGIKNVFVGEGAGFTNSSGSNNSFFGLSAGRRNTTGGSNSFFGLEAGFDNTGGSNNSFFGRHAGLNNETGASNSFFGVNAGLNNTLGIENVFLGVQAGNSNLTGGSNTVVGTAANVGAGNLNFAAAFGAYSVVGTDNTIVLGKIAGTYNGVQRPADNVKITGNLDVGGSVVNVQSQYNINNRRGLYFGADNNILIGDNNGQVTEGSNNVYLGVNAGGYFSNGSGFNTTGSNNTLIGADTNVGSPIASYRTAIGAGAQVLFNNSIVLGRAVDFVRVPGGVRIGGGLQFNFLYDGPGNTACRNSAGEMSFCSSSIRYKTNVETFTVGMNLINKLRPVSFDWKIDGKRDLGFIAEEINAAEPLLTIYNDKGQIEGVKYDRLSVAFVNAFKEQQMQIEAQQKQIEAQAKQISDLKQIVCGIKPDAEICQ